MYNRSQYNISKYNGYYSLISGGSETGAIKYVAFPKSATRLNRKMHVSISKYNKTTFPNEQKPVVIVRPPLPDIQIGNPIGLLLALTYGMGGTVVDNNPIAIVNGNPIGLLLALTYGSGGSVYNTPPQTGSPMGLLLALTKAIDVYVPEPLVLQNGEAVLLMDGDVLFT